MEVTLSQESFPAYVRRDRAALVSLAARLTGSAADGDDLVQDVLEQLARRWPQVWAMDSVDAYARRAVINRSRTRYRRRQAEREAFARLAPQPTVSAPDSDVATEWLWALVRALPGRHQPEVFALHVGEDRSLVEVAAILGISAASARQAYSRARQRLQLQVAKQT